jgi:phytoene synthase
VLQHLVSVARDRLAAARNLQGEIPEAALPAFLPAALVEPDLAALSRHGLAVLSEVADVPQWRRQLRLWRSARRGEF